MEFRDFTDPDKFVDMAFKAMCIILALAIIPGLLQAIFSHLAIFQTLIGFCFLLLLSPVAFLLWRVRQGGPTRHERRGAERTPVLPLMEDDYE